MLRSITQIFESFNNSVPPPFPIYGQWSSRMTSYVAMATKKLKNIFLTKSPTHSMKGLAIKIQLKCFIKIKIFVFIIFGQMYFIIDLAADNGFKMTEIKKRYFSYSKV